MNTTTPLILFPLLCKYPLVQLLPLVQKTDDHPYNNLKNIMESTTPIPSKLILQPVVVDMVSIDTFKHRKENINQSKTHFL